MKCIKVILVILSLALASSIRYNKPRTMLVETADECNGDVTCLQKNVETTKKEYEEAKAALAKAKSDKERKELQEKVDRLKAKWEGFKNAISNAANKVVASATNVVKSGVEAVKTTGKRMTAFGSSVIKKGGDLAEDFKNSVKSGLNKLGNLFKRGKDHVKKIMDAGKVWITEQASKVKAAGLGGVEKMKERVNKINQNLTDSVHNQQEALKEWNNARKAKAEAKKDAEIKAAKEEEERCLAEKERADAEAEIARLAKIEADKTYAAVKSCLEGCGGVSTECRTKCCK
ncbi:hypothetical protein GW796_11405 [archaeon]|nr:hypothetical protein [archaeon]